MAAGRLSAPWKARLQHSLTENSSLVYSKYVQLATVKLDGRPANRTVVFRGFLGEGPELTFITDARSNKVAEITANPHGELCWYFPTTREQYRLAGRVRVVAEACEEVVWKQERQAAWGRLSNAARSQFSWPQPGLPRSIFEQSAFEQQPPSAEAPALPPFCLVVFTVEEVDLVSLFTNKRETYVLKAPQGDGAHGDEHSTDLEWHYADVTP